MLIKEILVSIMVSAASNTLSFWYRLELDKKEMKKQYYREFMDALTERLRYMNEDSEKSLEAEREFYKQCNRLTLYASEDVVEQVQAFIKGTEKYNETELMKKIRIDICKGDVKKYKQNSEIKLLCGRERKNSGDYKDVEIMRNEVA